MRALKIVFIIAVLSNMWTTGQAQTPVKEWELDNTFFVTDIEVSADGRIYAVDQEQHQVRIFDAEGTLVRVVGKEGKEPGEFQRPQAIALSPDEQTFAVRDWNRRVSLFSSEGTYQQSFVLPNILPSTSMAFVNDSLLVIGGVEPGALHSEAVIHLYTTSGKRVTSFFAPTEKAKRLKATVIAGVGFDRGGNHLYAVQPIDYAIAVFTLRGKRERTIQVTPPAHYQPLTTPQPSRVGTTRWALEISALRRLFVVNEDLLLVTVEKPGDTSYMDLIDKETGRVVYSCPLEGWVVSADPERGWIYVAEAQYVAETQGALVTMLRAYRVGDLLEAE